MQSLQRDRFCSDASQLSSKKGQQPESCKAVTQEMKRERQCYVGAGCSQPHLLRHQKANKKQTKGKQNSPIPSTKLSEHTLSLRHCVCTCPSVLGLPAFHVTYLHCSGHRKCFYNFLFPTSCCCVLITLSGLDPQNAAAQTPGVWIPAQWS